MTTPPDPEFLKARRVVERLIKIRLRSEYELTVRLREKRISPLTITKILNHLKRLGLLDDVLFARAWIASRMNKPFGLRRIRWELNLKGVSEDIIEQEIVRAAGDYDEQEAVSKIVKRRLRQYEGIPKVKMKHRLFGYLSRRGFSSHSIYKTLREIN